MNKDSHTPLHIQLKNKIEQEVIDGKYEDQIPSERDFMQEYNVSRSTVREAINALVREGVLVKKHGKGTYISIKPLDRWLGQLTSTTEVIHRLGMEPSAKLLAFHKMEAPTHIQSVTGFKEIYYLKRLRLANNIPLGIEQQYYPIYIGEQLANYNLDEITLYDVIQNDLNIPFSEAKQKITCSPIPEEDIEHMQVDENMYMLRAERIIKGADGSTIEYEEAYYRSDMYTFELNLSRKFGS